MHLDKSQVDLWFGQVRLRARQRLVAKPMTVADNDLAM